MKQFVNMWFGQGNTQEYLMGQLSNLILAIDPDQTAEIAEDYIINGTGKFNGKHVLIPLLVDYNLGNPTDKMGSNFSFNAETRLNKLVDYYTHNTMGKKIYDEGGIRIEDIHIEFVESS